MRVIWQLLSVVGLLGAGWIAGCTGNDGKDGAVGPAGAQGPQGDAGPAGEAGPQGPAGPAGEAGPPGADGTNGSGGDSGSVEGGLNVSCLGPCHGFSGIVEQWKTSTHYAVGIANLGGTEVATWTGATACGNCHAIDAIEQRVAGTVTVTTGSSAPAHLANGQLSYSSSGKSAESTYAGQATVAQVSCQTCHDTSAANDPHVTGKNYTPNSFPLRVPVNDTDRPYIEKSSAVGVFDGTPVGYDATHGWGHGNACVWCHKSRKDVTNFITASNVVTNTFWGPHEGPQADIYSGKGGYHYAGANYGQSTHQVSIKNGCVGCHMPVVASNDGIGNHSFYADLSTCKDCHATASNYDVGGGQSAMKGGIQELRVALNNKGMLTRSAAAPYQALASTDLADQNFDLDQPLPSATAYTADQAGALYNYLLLARGSAGGVHNPLYTRQLIFDSVKAITGSAPLTIPIRPVTEATSQ